MIGVLANAFAIILGSCLGILLKKGIPEAVSNTVMKALGFCVLVIGINGALSGENTLILILSMAIGALIGAWLDIDTRFSNCVRKIENKFRTPGRNNSLADGFITASLVFCVGAMAIVGSLEAGINGDNRTLFTKSIIDGISAFIFASAMGIGVAFSAGLIFLYQGGIVLLAQIAAPFLTDTIITEMTAAGSVVIMAIGLNLSDITKLKIMNFLPAVFLPLLLCPLYDVISAFLASMI